MKKLYFLLIFILSITGAFAQNADYSYDFVNRYKAAQFRSTQSDASTADRLWKTAFLWEAKKNWNLLTHDAKVLVKPGYFLKADNDRPTFSDEEIYVSTYFKFHYEITGTYAIDPTDDDLSGFPDYIEWMASLFDDIYYIDSAFGFSMPPADLYGGDSKYDIYIGGQIGTENAINPGTYGFVSPEDSIGDNPATTLTETYSYTSWMCMNYDYSWAGSGSSGAIDTAVSVTIAHEFMHSIQMGYSLMMESWFKEACATWSEEAHFPGYDDNFQYLMNLFGKPDAALNLDDNTDELEGTDLFNHWYSSWLFIKYLTEKEGDQVVVEIYEQYLDEDYASSIIDAVLTSSYDLSFNTVFENFIVANYAMTNLTEFEPYTYERAIDYLYLIIDSGGFYIDGDISFTGADVDFDSEIDGNGRLMRLSTDYLDIYPDQEFSVIVTPKSPTSEIKALFMSYYPDSIKVDTLNVNADGTLSVYIDNIVDYDYFSLVVYRYDDSNDTLSEQYTVTVTADIVNTKQMPVETASISFSPNPVKNFMTIKNANSFIDGRVTIYGITGNVVYSGTLTSQQDLSALPVGIYFIEITSNNTVLLKEKFIKE